MAGTHCENRVPKVWAPLSGQSCAAASRRGGARLPFLIIWTDFDSLEINPLPSVTTPLIEIAGLSKNYRGAGQPALNELTLDIPRGAFFGLLGPNGAGKSTLISILCGLLSPSHGRVRIQGLDVLTNAKGVKAILGLVPQELAIYPTLTARENLAFFGRMQGLTGAALRQRVDSCLAIARLEEYADRRTETFSGGLKRRLNLVVGLVHEPQLLVLDEPTVGIDPQSRNFIHESLRMLHQTGMTIVYTTHYMDEVEQLCDDVAIIDHGRILARGSVPELLRHHHHGAIEAQFENELPATTVETLRHLPQVRDCQIDARAFTLQSDDPAGTLTTIVAALQRDGVRPVSLNMGAANLEQVFLALTGTRLRD